MKWPWVKQERDTTGLHEARQQLMKAQADEVRIAALVDAHKRQQRKNHFGPRIAAALKEQQ